MTATPRRLRLVPHRTDADVWRQIGVEFEKLKGEFATIAAVLLKYRDWQSMARKEGGRDAE